MVLSVAKLADFLFIISVKKACKTGDIERAAKIDYIRNHGNLRNFRKKNKIIKIIKNFFTSLKISIGTDTIFFVNRSQNGSTFAKEFFCGILLAC